MTNESNEAVKKAETEKKRLTRRLYAPYIPA
jgi:hypothetical protein